MRRSLALLAAAPLLAFPLALRADEAKRADETKQAERLAALARELGKPDGMRAAFKLVDAGPAAVPELLARLGTSPLADERIEACLREIARAKEGARVEAERLVQAPTTLARARLARALAAAKAPEAIYPLVDALDFPQEPLEVQTFGPSGDRPRETSKVRRPVSSAIVAFGERAVPALEKRLAASRSSAFRIEAMSVLGSLKAVATLPALQAIAQDEARGSDERAAAISALAAIGSPKAKDAISVALGSENAYLRRAAARGLASVPDPSALPQVAKLLEDEKDDETRLDYVRALAALEDPLALGPLQTALAAAPKAGELSRGPLAQACIRGMAATGDRGAAGPLVAVLDMGLGFHVEHAAAAALTRMPDLGTAPRERLREIVDQKSVTVPRACAAWVLAQRGEEGPQKALFESAKSREWAVRVAAATLLGEGKLDGAVPVLAALASDSQANVRRATAFSLGHSEDSHAGAALARARLHLDVDPVVRRLYAGAFSEALTQGTLDREQQPQARRILIEALERDFPDATLEERRAQAFSLARLGDRPALLRMATGVLASSELPQDSRRAAIEALGKLGRNEATEQALEGAIRDPKVGDDAALALARMRGETFFESQWRALLAPAVPFR